ncbi:hypothetical protein L1787_01015 [Acuticoccus sp. M5D2P5]|uniref:shikimate dehydrogenase family protein n=1 Tax=Acuticoccus kalidii TaxID=2910977 RepID=UPI001F277C4A|nr:hypothetical protein [Acuticoccus kalidii]MCF3931992.1 hypothetical protein [Acuticoccus kalidii]
MARARHYLMVAAPITSVRTPPLLEAWFAARGIPARCDVRHVELADLDALMDEVRADETLDGLMVSMPLKRAMLPLLDSVSETARAVGSVNAVKRVGARGLVGDQFDGIALARAVAARGVDLAAARVTLAGVGGAGLAIALAFAEAGCTALTLVDTEHGRLAEAAALLKRPPSMLAPGDPRPAADILINATPLGMAADDPSPFSAEEVGAAALVADIVAVPNETRLADLARTMAVPLVSGYDMVTFQIDPIGAFLTS